MKAWVVLDDAGNPLELSTDPWGDGDCLTDNLPLFTVFGSKNKATYALKLTKKYAKGNKFPDNLCELWNMKEWKVKEIDIPNLELA